MRLVRTCAVVGTISLHWLCTDVAAYPKPVGPEAVVNTYTTSFQRRPAVAKGDLGDFVVVWESDGSAGGDTSDVSIQANIYNSDGSALTSNFQVNTFTTGAQRSPDVATEGNGDFVVVWTRDSGTAEPPDATSVRGRRYDAFGTALGGVFLVNSYTTNLQREPAVASDADGDFVVVWESFSQDGDGFGVFGQRYDSSGSPVGSEFQINTYTTANQLHVDVAMDDDGDFVVVWASFFQEESGYGIFGQRYDNAGSAAGGEFQVNTYTTYSQDNPTVAMENDGAFVVSWSSNIQDGSGQSVQAQRYDSSGSTIGGEFQVNTTTLSGQNYPAVAMADDGGFVVTFMGYAGAAQYEIFGQRYDSSGTAVGGETQLNTYTTSQQRNPQVAIEPDGNFVVVWRSLGQDGDDEGIIRRSFEPGTTSTSTTTSTSSSTSSTTTTSSSTSSSTSSTTSTSSSTSSTTSTSSSTTSTTSSTSSTTSTSSSTTSTTSSTSSTTSTTTLPIPGIGISASKLIVIDKTFVASKAKVVYVSKDPAVTKGTGTDPAMISVTFDLAYTNGSTGGSFLAQAGAFTGSDGWVVNKSTVAKYVNKPAPTGPTGLKVVVIKPAKVLKIVGKSLGDTPIDIFTTGAPDASGVDTESTVVNGAETNRHCTHFAGADCSYKMIAGGTGAKLVCKPGAAAPCP